MSGKAQTDFEFASFVFSIPDPSRNQMLRQVEEEITEISKLSVDDPMIR